MNNNRQQRWIAVWMTLLLLFFALPIQGIAAETDGTALTEDTATVLDVQSQSEINLTDSINILTQSEELFASDTITSDHEDAVDNDPTPKVTLLTTGNPLPTDDGYPYAEGETEGYVYQVGDTAEPLRIAYTSAAEGGTWSLQWQQSFTKSGFSTVRGATQDSYIPGTTNSDVKPTGQFFRCRATYYLNGKSYKADSDWVYVYVKGTEVDEPQIIRQPQDGLYFLGISPAALLVSANKKDNGSLSYQWYQNNTKSTEGATAIEGADQNKYTPTMPETAGVRYYYCVITNTLQKFQKSVTSEIAEVRYRDASELVGDDLKGDGTQEHPYLLESAEDFGKLKEFVAQGISFAGSYFHLTADVTLPEGWEGIGAGSTSGNGKNIKPFSGRLDGGGHTLSFPFGSAPLFQYVREAVIEKLNIVGSFIKGNGLVNQYVVDYGADGSYSTGCPNTVSIDRVTVKTGTVIEQSGFIGGFASGENAIRITNCVIEPGVKIGYDAEENQPSGASRIGGFAGDFNGSIINCQSAATVYGADYVGGIVGGKGQTAGNYNIRTCTFTGEIIASGNFVGGIAGGGYSGNRWGVASAPNTPCANIENCYVNATISGKDKVGGIFGGEEGSTQCWGDAYIRNNFARGTVTAAEGSSGAIVGYMNALNCKNIIVGNLYFEGVSDRGIGAVGWIDTNCTTHETASRAKYFNSAVSLDGTPKGVSRKDHNRSDDPLGADADTLCTLIPVSAPGDSSIVERLNAGEGSFGNWVLGTDGPILSSEPIAYQLTLSGEYAKTYYIGDELDTAHMEFTALWTDGTVTHPTADELEITGYQPSVRGVQTVRVRFGAAATEFEVTVLKRSGGGTSDTIRVRFSLLGDSKHGAGEIHTLKNGKLETWIAERSYSAGLNDTAWDVIKKILDDMGYTYENPSGNYMESITKDGVKLGEFDNGAHSGWMFTINGKHGEKGLSEQFLEDNDRIVLHYTDDYEKEQESDRWSGGGGASSASSLPQAVEKVIQLIAAIGTVDQDSGARIQAARAAYESLSRAEQSRVTNAKVLTAAEDAFAALEKQEEKPPAMQFEDVVGHWAEDAIGFVVREKLFFGTSSSAFEPDMTMNRAMLVTVLWRMDGMPQSARNPLFTDLEEGAYYQDAVMWAAEQGIVNGTSETTFSPERAVTREELAAILFRYAVCQDEDGAGKADLGRFEDAGDVSDYATEAMAWACGKGLISGRTETELIPQGSATRAEVATILQRWMDFDAKTAAYEY